MAYQEPEYCYNCDSEAVCYADWKDANGKKHRTFMCQTCQNAFELGQVTPEPTVNIE